MDLFRNDAELKGGGGNRGIVNYQRDRDGLEERAILLAWLKYEALSISNLSKNTQHVSVKAYCLYL